MAATVQAMVPMAVILTGAVMDMDITAMVMPVVTAMVTPVVTVMVTVMVMAMVTPVVTVMVTGMVTPMVTGVTGMEKALTSKYALLL